MLIIILATRNSTAAVFRIVINTAVSSGIRNGKKLYPVLLLFSSYLSIDVPAE